MLLLGLTSTSLVTCLSLIWRWRGFGSSFSLLVWPQAQTRFSLVGAGAGPHPRRLMESSHTGQEQVYRSYQFSRHPHMAPLNSFQVRRGLATGKATVAALRRAYRRRSIQRSVAVVHTIYWDNSWNGDPSMQKFKDAMRVSVIDDYEGDTWEAVVRIGASQKSAFECHSRIGQVSRWRWMSATHYPEQSTSRRQRLTARGFSSDWHVLLVKAFYIWIWIIFFLLWWLWSTRTIMLKWLTLRATINSLYCHVETASTNGFLLQ